MEYVAVFQKLGENWAGYVPDVPGCLATGMTEKEVTQNLQEAFLTFNELRTSPSPIPHTFVWHVTTSPEME